MKFSDIFNFHNLILLLSLYLNINIYTKNMIALSGSVSYSLLILQILLNILLLFVTKNIKNPLMEILIFLSFTLIIYITDYMKKYEKDNCNCESNDDDKIEESRNNYNYNNLNDNWDYSNQLGYNNIENDNDNSNNTNLEGIIYKQYTSFNDNE